MSIEQIVVDKLVELARNPTPTAMGQLKANLRVVEIERDRLTTEVTSWRKGDEYLTELHKAAKAVAHKRAVGKQDNSPEMVRLRGALKAAEPYIDQIPF